MTTNLNQPRTNFLSISTDSFVDKFENKGRAIVTKIITANYDVVDIKYSEDKYSYWDITFLYKEGGLYKVGVVEVKVRTIPSIKYSTDIIERKKYERLLNLKSKDKRDVTRLYFLCFTDRIIEYNLDRVNLTPSSFYSAKVTANLSLGSEEKLSYELDRNEATFHKY